MTPDSVVRLDPFWPEGASLITQGRGNLGRRMDRALRDLPPGPAVLIGGDIPGIEPKHIARAFRALRRNPYVFGPADDGGFWLVGARRGARFDRLFDNVCWSTETTLAETLRNVPGGDYALVDTLSDVDDADDLAKLSATSAASDVPSDAA